MAAGRAHDGDVPHGLIPPVQHKVGPRHGRHVAGAVHHRVLLRLSTLAAPVGGRTDNEAKEVDIEVVHRSITVSCPGPSCAMRTWQWRRRWRRASG